MNVLILDVETTTSNKGNPFDQTNRLVCVGLNNSTRPHIIYFPCSHEDLLYLQGYINSADIVVGFNIKFDLHWLRKIGIDISKIKVWDCQIAEFILNYQQTKYPSLDEAALKYGYPPKIDIVKKEFWDKGIDTDKIPQYILSDYLTQDLNLTQQIYERQLEQFKTIRKNSFPLFKLQCADLLVLEEIEWNGIKFNTEKAKEKAETLKKEVEDIDEEISRAIGSVPVNLGSNDDVSCILYGGNITVDSRIPIGIYKSGEKQGQTRYKIITKEYTLPRLVEPIKDTEVKKGGYWEVNETVLRKLKPTLKAKKVIALINKYAELEKLRGTYLLGYSNLIAKMNWPTGMLHGTLNQCVAITGRLSSSKPNLQNADPITKVFMESRYD